MKTNLHNASMLQFNALSFISWFNFFAFFTVTSFAVAGPRIQFATPIFDFGQVKNGEVVQHTFIFTNIGDQLLELTDVRPSCGCTTAGAWDRTVQPGKTGEIPVQFNSANFAGAVGKTVIVLCNDPLQTNIVLQIKGTIWKPVEITPATAWFSASSDRETNETRRIQILSNLQEPLELSQPECTNKAFQTTLKTVRPGKEFELTVTLLRARDPATVTAPITLKTTSTNVPVIIIPAYAMIQPAVAATPTQLTLPAGRLASGLQLNVNIRNNGTNPLVLSKPTVDAPGAEIRVQEVQPGRYFILSANFPAGLQIQPNQTAEIRVKTNHPQFPLLKIPVVGSHTLAASLGETEASPPVTR
jgi:hypothetical protein